VLARDPVGLIGLAAILLIVFASLLGPSLYGVDPFDLVDAPFSPPGGELPLGTDYLGRDILAGLLVGGRASLLVGLAAALISVSIGVSIGLLAGWSGGWVDTVLMKVTEFFQVLPALLFAMVLVALFGARLWIETMAIGLVSWPGVARLTRAECLRLRELDFVTSTVAAGAAPGYLLLRVVLPNALPPIIVAATLSVGVAILFEGGLSFLGLGDPNVMTWGLMLGQNRSYLQDAWWAVTFPGAAIFLAVLAVSLLGDGINDALNPRLSQR
jgi:peptide/nickel transport system permease protein